jgi:hypothetical protein
MAPECSIQHWQQQETRNSERGVDTHVERRQTDDPIPRRARFMHFTTRIAVQSDIDAGDGKSGRRCSGDPDAHTMKGGMRRATWQRRGEIAAGRRIDDTLITYQPAASPASNASTTLCGHCMVMVAGEVTRLLGASPSERGRQEPEEIRRVDAKRPGSDSGACENARAVIVECQGHLLPIFRLLKWVLMMRLQ